MSLTVQKALHPDMGPEMGVILRVRTRKFCEIWIHHTLAPPQPHAIFKSLRAKMNSGPSSLDDFDKALEEVRVILTSKPRSLPGARSRNKGVIMADFARAIEHAAWP